MTSAERNIAWALIGILAGPVAIGAGTPRAWAAESPPAVTVERTCPAPAESGEAADAPYRPGAIRPGDRIKLSFYEVLRNQDDKWGSDRQRQEPSKGFQLRAELSNEYLVQDDGTISIPLLGVFPAERLLPLDLQQQLGCAFDAFLGHHGFVNVLNVVKQPIYVVGPFKKTGSFDYTSGMTVLHAVSLAGGFDRETINPWQLADLTRETERLQTAVDRAMRLVARTVAIEAARRTGAVAVPTELAELAGKSEAEALLREELTPRRLETHAFDVERSTLQSAVDAANTEYDLRRKRLTLLDQAIALRKERLASLTKLVDKGQLARPVIMQAQSELLDAEDRRQETMTTLGVVSERRTKAEQDLQARESQVALLRRRDLLDVQIEASKAAAESEAAINVFKALAKAQIDRPSIEITDFVIVRRSRFGVATIHASETTQLEPGDLVQAFSRSRPQTDLRAEQSTVRN